MRLKAWLTYNPFLFDFVLFSASEDISSSEACRSPWEGPYLTTEKSMGISILVNRC